MSSFIYTKEEDWDSCVPIYDIIVLPVIPVPEWQGGSNLSEEYYINREKVYGDEDTRKN